MATERLVVELDADSKSLDASLKKTNKNLNDIDKSVKQVDKDLKNLSSTAGRSGKAFGKAEVATKKLGGAFKLQKNSAQQLGFQLQDVAVQAQGGTSAFQILGQQGSQLAGVLGPGGALLGAAIAIGAAIGGVLFKSFGSASSAVEDLNEKLKDLIETSTLTKEQSAVLVNAEKREIEEKNKKIDSINEEIEAQEKFTESMALSAANLKEQIGTEGVFGKKVTESTDKINELIATRQLLNAEIGQNNANIEIYTAATGKATGRTIEQQSALTNLIETIATQNEIFGLGNRELLERELRLRGATEAEIEATLATFDNTAAKTEQLAAENELEASADRIIQKLKSKQQLIEENYLAEKEVLDNAVLDEEVRKEQLLLLQEKFNNDLLALNKKRVEVEAKTETDAQKIARKSAEDLEKGKTKAKEGFTRDAAALNTVLFNDNKAIGAGIIIAETAQNVVTSVKNSGGIPSGLPAGAAAAAMGIAQLANLNSANKGGGSISSSAGSSVPAISAPEPIETSTLEVSEQSEAGTNTVVVEFATGTGDTLIDALSESLNENQRQGR